MWLISSKTRDHEEKERRGKDFLYTCSKCVRPIRNMHLTENYIIATNTTTVNFFSNLEWQTCTCTREAEFLSTDYSRLISFWQVKTWTTSYYKLTALNFYADSRLNTKEKLLWKQLCKYTSYNFIFGKMDIRW